MNGPTPIISSMLKRTAERRPMRRWRVAGDLAEVRVIVQRCSGGSWYPRSQKRDLGHPASIVEQSFPCGLKPKTPLGLRKALLKPRLFKANKLYTGRKHVSFLESTESGGG